MPTKTYPQSTAAVALASSPVERSKYTDQANAERFFAAHKHDVRWVEAWRKWYYFDGKRWARDDIRKVEEYAQEVARKIWEEAATLGTKNERDECGTWAATSEKGDRHETMLKRVKPLLAVPPDMFDTNPDILNCLNGTVDLRTGDLRDHDPNDMITKLVPYNYDPSAACPMWEGHLEKVLPETEVREFLQRALGYSITGKATERKLFFCYGKGKNGKSVTLNTVHTILDEYAANSSPSLLLRRRDGQVDTYAMVKLRGYRFVTAIDQQEVGSTFSDATIKMLASDDPITARGLYRDFETFEPTHTLWLATNNKPKIRGTDDGVWDRLAEIPFTYRISEAERDGDFEDKLKGEHEGVLRWLIDGAVEWYAKGLATPASVQKATDEFREESDVFGDFLDECTVDDPAAYTSSADLYAKYEEWAKNVGVKPWTRRSVTEELKFRGYEYKRTKSERGFNGIELAGASSKSSHGSYSGFGGADDDDDDTDGCGVS